MGLRYMDKAVVPGGRYLYRVFVAGQDANIHFDTAYVLVDVVTYVVPPAPTVFAAEGRDHSITLRWRNSVAAPFSAFVVNRYDEKRTTYVMVGVARVPGILPEGAVVVRNGELVDTPVANYFTYKYRIVGEVIGDGSIN